jgi:hypothetical protein
MVFECVHILLVYVLLIIFKMIFKLALRASIPHSIQAPHIFKRSASRPFCSLFSLVVQ